MPCLYVCPACLYVLSVCVCVCVPWLPTTRAPSSAAERLPAHHQQPARLPYRALLPAWPPRCCLSSACILSPAAEWLEAKDKRLRFEEKTQSALQKSIAKELEWTRQNQKGQQVGTARPCTTL